MLRRGMVGRRGPGLLGTVARTAVVAGTATATANAMKNRQTRAAADDRSQQPAPEQAQQQVTDNQPPSGRPTSGGSTSASDGNDLTGKLQQLADLNASGALSDAEFAAAKSKLLGI